MRSLAAQRGRAAVQNIPEVVEDTISRLEKKSKDLEKDQTATSKQKMLKGLLEKL